MENTAITIPLPDKPYVKGKDLFSRRELKEMISYEGRLLDPEMLDLSAKMKFALIYMHSMYGRVSLDARFSFSKLKQKTIKEVNFPDLSDDELSAYMKLYNYAYMAYYKEDEEVCQFVNAKFMASSFYEVFHYLIVESLYDITGVSFFEHLGELSAHPSNGDLQAYYNKRREAYDPIRNNMLLFYIRNQSVFDLVFLREMASNYKHIEVLKYRNGENKIESVLSSEAEEPGQEDSLQQRP